MRDTNPICSYSTYRRTAMYVNPIKKFQSYDSLVMVSATNGAAATAIIGDKAFLSRRVKDNIAVQVRALWDLDEFHDMRLLIDSTYPLYPKVSMARARASNVSLKFSP